MSNAQPSLPAASRLAGVSAALVESVLVFCLWLGLSLLSSGWLLRLASPPPAARMLWSFPLVLAASFLSAQSPLARMSRQSWGVRVAFILTLALTLLGGPDAALPGVLTFAAATLARYFSATDRIRAALERHAAWAATVVGAAATLLLLEAALQAVALAVAGRAGPALAPRQDPDELLILCLGDSFTYGLGASDREHAWPSRLESLLREALPGRGVHVLNAGQPGRNSSALRRWLEKELPRLSPDAVVVACGVNNPWDVRDVDPAASAAADGLSRAELWKMEMQQAALHIRLYRLFRLREVRLAPSDESQLPFGLRVEYLDPGREEARVAVLQESASRDPGDAKACKELAIRLCRLSRNQEALIAIENALGAAPNDPDLWNLKGWILSFLRRRDPAVQAFDRAVELGQPTDDYYLCLSFACLFDEEAALAHVRGLQRSRPDLYARLPRLDDDFFRQRRYLRILDHDLAAMEELCRSRGALFLVHDYPYAGPVSSCLADFGRAHDCFLVSHAAVFEKRRSAGTADPLFAYDGHCTDEGYQMMAEQILPPLLTTLRAHGLVAAASP